MRTRALYSFASWIYSKVGLWSIWTSGLVLVCLALYAIQSLPILSDQIREQKIIHTSSETRDSGVLAVTIFSAPNPFEGLVGARQTLSVQSWLAISPHVKVVLFGQHQSIFSFAATFHSRVSIESNIDFTFLGTPFFHSMVARSRASNSDVSVLVDPEIVLLPDCILTLHYAHKLEHDWLLVAMPPNVSHFPFHLDETGQHWLQGDGKRMKDKKLQEFLIQNWQSSSCNSRFLMAWNTGELPLHAGVLPPFLYKRGFHDQWVVSEALSSGTRFVFDATSAISSFYLENIEDKSNQFLKGSKIYNANNRERFWEFKGNAHLAASYGSFYFNQDNSSINLVRLIKCNGQYMFVNTTEDFVFPIKGQDLHTSSMLQQAANQGKGRSNWWMGKIMQFSKAKKWLACRPNSISLVRGRNCSRKDSYTLSAPLYLPFALKLLLETVADGNKSVVLAVAGNNYREMLMSWVCRLRRLSITNFVICALDAEIYQFSILQGLPVFKDPLAPTNISFNDCHFGTTCFQRVTKVKSRLVLQLLKMGYNVLLSDVDVYWFDNPLPFLSSYGPAVLLAQSDEYKRTVPKNLPRRLNSGFYFARSDLATISAMEKVVKHAIASDLSEQPSFYDVLCGEDGVNRLGDDTCLEPETNLTIHFLDRNRFPNGAYQGLWSKSDIKAACKMKGCLILHNNWISGRENKLERQLLSGLWAYDSCTRLCLQDWLGSRTSSCF